MSIKTRFLIISDTHGLDLPEESCPEERVDVAIHCGDMTDSSRIEEYHTALRLLQQVDAPLKLVIPGNHDVSTDERAMRRLVQEAFPPLDLDLAVKECSEVRALMTGEHATEHGIHFLEEGTHKFALANGAALTVYASPYTPAFGNGAFQFEPGSGHNFAIPQDVDLVMTHGPPRGILDRVPGSGSVGCRQLFEAVERARPRLHCFGHIHVGWGAKFVAWREEAPPRDDEPARTHFSAIDTDNSAAVANLASVKPGKFDSAGTLAEKKMRKAAWEAQKRCGGSFCANNPHHVMKGRHTVFVNAAIGGPHDERQLPWVVDVDLPAAT
ncbi:hypothetical protein RB595_005159 [Gaeumannomyces hyphopodioides]